VSGKRAKSARPANSSGKRQLFPKNGGPRSINAFTSTSCKAFFSEGERGWLRQAIGQALGAIKGELRKEFRTAIDGLRSELNAAKNQLQERLARLPLVKTWTPGAVAYCGDVIVFNGNTWQARKDTGQKPGDDDWILIARAGRDGCDGHSPNPRGIFNAYKTYARLDVVECNGAGYLALRNNPGVPGIDDGWQLVSGPGHRGDTGAVGPRGRKGERGARGEDAPTIINWTLDRKNYRAIPTMSNGTQGAVLELRPLFETYMMETQGWAAAE
jgi:hypothetical protein